MRKTLNLAALFSLIVLYFFGLRVPTSFAQTPNWNNSLPNIKPVDVTFDANKKPTIRIKNIGPGKFYPVLGQVSLYYGSGTSNRGEGGEYIDIKKFDVTNNTMEVGQVATYTSDKSAPNDATKYELVVNEFKAFQEYVGQVNGFGDNTMTGNTPAPNYPDLIISEVKFDSEHKPTISVKNEGLWEATRFSRTNAAVNLSFSDKDGKKLGGEETYYLKEFTSEDKIAAGQTVTYSSTKVAPTEAVRYVANLYLRDIWNNVVLIQEDSVGTSNNSKEGEVAFVIPAITPTPAPLKVTDAGILPDSPFYIFKEVGRAITSTFTFGEENKIKLQTKFVDEKILEAAALNNQGKSDKAAGQLEKIGQDLNQINKLAENLKKKEPEKANQIISNLNIQQENAKNLIVQIEKQPTLTDNAKKAINDSKGNVGQQLAPNSNNLPNTSTESAGQFTPMPNLIPETLEKALYSPIEDKYELKIYNRGSKSISLGESVPDGKGLLYVTQKFYDASGQFISELTTTNNRYDRQIKPGEFYDVDVRLSLVPPGATKLTVLADIKNNIIETSEDDNQKTFDLPRLPTPNLIPEKFEHWPLSPVDDSYNLDVYNRGDGSIFLGPEDNRQLWIHWTYLDSAGKVLKEIDTVNNRYEHEVKPGDKFDSNQYLSAMPAGTSKVKVQIDTKNNYKESNEGDNEKTFDLPKLAGPNLVPEKIEKPYASPVEDRYDIKVYNRGSSSAKLAPDAGDLAVLEKYLNENGDVLGERTTTNNRYGREIKPGEFYDVGIYLSTIPAGTKKIFVQVDVNNKIAESNEGDNQNTLEIGAVAGPNLVPEKFERQPYSPSDDLYQVKIYNRGSTPIKLGESVPNGKGILYVKQKYYDGSGQFISELTTTNNRYDRQIKPGEFYDVDVRIAQLPQGTAKLVVEVDLQNNIAESNEGDNTKSFEVPKTKFADLIIDSVTVTSSGHVVMVLKNIGEGIAYLKQGSKYTTTEYTLLDKNNQRITDAIWQPTVETLAPGKTISGELDFSNPEFIKNAADYRAVADSNYVVTETNENNNTYVHFNATINYSAVEATISAQKKVSLELKEATVSSPVILASSLSNIKALPCEPLYVVKNIGRAVESILTFGDENKAKLAVKNADAKTAEAAELSAKNKSDCAVGALSDAAKELEKSNNLIDNIAKKDPAKAAEIAGVAFAEQLKQQQAAASVVKGSTGANLVNAKGARDKALDQMAKTIDKVVDLGKIKDIITKESDKPDPLSPVANLEVFVALEDKVKAADKKEVFDQVKKDSVIKVKQVLQSLPEDKKQLFTDYVKGVAGDETNKIKLIDEIRRENLDSSSKVALVDAKEEVVDDFRLKIKDIPEKDNKSQLEAMSDLTDGSTEDLRVLAELTKGLDSDLDVVSVDPVTEESAGNFAEEIMKLEPEQKKEVISEIAEEFDDLNQVIVYDDIIETVKDESDKKVFEELGASLKEEIKEDLESSSSAELKQEVLETFSDRSPEDLDALKDHADYFEQKTYEKIVESQLSLLKDEIKYEADDAKDYKEVFEDEEYKKFLDSQGGETQKLGDYFEKYDWETKDDAGKEPAKQEVKPEAKSNLEVVKDEPFESQKTESPGSSREIVCDDKYEPVCGSDGETYDNKCKFEKEAENWSDLEIAYEGKCDDEVLGVSTSQYDNSEVVTTLLKLFPPTLDPLTLLIRLML